MQRFQERRRVIVAAEQFRRDVKPWPDGVRISNAGTDDELHTVMTVGQGTTHELFVLCDGDWVVRRDDGSTIVCCDSLFREKYEPVL